MEEDIDFELTTRVSSPPSYPTWYVTFIVVQGRSMSPSVGIWHSPFVASSTVERASLFVSLSFVITVRYDTSHPFLEGTFIYQICVVTVDWLILWLSPLLSLPYTNVCVLCLFVLPYTVSKQRRKPSNCFIWKLQSCYSVYATLCITDWL